VWGRSAAAFAPRRRLQRLLEVAVAHALIGVIGDKRIEARLPSPICLVLEQVADYAERS
jgi:hypothetical protein